VDDFNRRPPADPLALAEAAAAGRLAVPAAEATLRAAAPDARRADEALAEFRDLLGAARAVREHAEAFRGAHDAAPTAAPTARRTAAASQNEAARPGSMDVTPRRLDRQDVRVRRRSSSRPSRFGPVGALLAAAVVVVAVVVAPRILPPGAGSPNLSGSSVAVAPSTAPSAPRSSADTATAVDTPQVTSAAPNIPPVANGSLPGAPAAYFWSATDDGTFRVWLWTPGQPLKEVVTFTGGIPGPATEVRRTVVAAPDGRAFAVAETMASGNGQFRIVNADGQGPPPIKGLGDWTIVWSADASRVAYAILPEPWTVAAAEPNGSWTVHTFEGSDEPAALFAFSTDGTSLYGYKTAVEADFWERPIRLDLKSNAYTDMTAFPGGAAGVAATNGTTKSDQVDPSTGRVVDSGTAQGGGWETRDGPKATPLATRVGGGIEGQAVVWGLGGRLVIDELPADPAGRPDGVSIVTYGLQDDQPSPAFMLEGGTYRAGMLGARNGYALLGIGADPGQTTDIGQPIWDEAIMIELADGATAVVVPDDPGAGQVHFAGWGLLPGLPPAP
jgi:hypothetical protein